MESSKVSAMKNKRVQERVKQNLSVITSILIANPRLQVSESSSQISLNEANRLRSARD